LEVHYVYVFDHDQLPQGAKRLVIEKSITVIVLAAFALCFAAYQGFRTRERGVVSRLVLAFNDENGIAAWRCTGRCSCKPPKLIFKQGCTEINPINQ
jgi:hypothetical protein